MNVLILKLDQINTNTHTFRRKTHEDIEGHTYRKIKNKKIKI